MNRKNFLRSLGAIGIASMVPSNHVTQLSAASRLQKRMDGTCVLIPSETRGPYPLDLSQDYSKFRQQINEDKTGLPLNVTFTIVNINDSCSPVTNARVDVWHCDKDGVYSGYNQPGINTVGQTFCRGIQMTDANGQVRFSTIYPGWYNGRITHVHFEIYLNSVLSVTSQLCFPDSLNTSVYQTTLYAAHGQNSSVANNAADQVFSDGYSTQLASISANSEGGYDAELLVGIDMKTSGVALLEPETGGQFRLLQNSPNPFADRCRIPFVLANPALVLLEIYALDGRKVATVLDEYRDPGEHEVVLNAQTEDWNLQDAAYVYQLSTTNSFGHFSQCKVLTRVGD